MATTASEGLVAADLPGLFEAADSASIDGQRRYVRTVWLRLLLAIMAAAFGAIQWKVGQRQVDVAAIGTTLALVGVLLTELGLHTVKPELRWYDGRALAESAKSLAWRFSVGALPFPKGGDEPEIERRFIRRIHDLLKDAPTTSIQPSRRQVITEGMRRLRAADLATRRAAYLEGRIDDQLSWYSRKAESNDRLARHWGFGLLAVELAGIAAALAKVAGYIQLDIAGVVAAMIAAGTAWVGLRQLSMLARAYTFAANELAIARGELDLARDEPAWAEEVADAEEAVSREHMMWRASRSRASR
jgi:hypothetical protein